jgi:nuclear transport factor 2 (NTF2) superfamily protein
MPGTRVIRNGSPAPIPRTAAGATVPSSSTGARRSSRELEYRLIKELWAFHGNRIAVRFQYEWRDEGGNWFRAHGNELWEFDDGGLMRRREASINDVPITAGDRRFLWQPQGPRPADHPGLSELGL